MKLLCFELKQIDYCVLVKCHIAVFFLFIIGIDSGSLCFGQISGNADLALSDRRVAYHIEARLDPDSQTIIGSQRVVWRNPDNIAVEELQFHLYLNAFKDTLSTFMVESGGVHRGFTAQGDRPWGRIDIKRMAVLSQENGDTNPVGRVAGSEIDVTDRMEFIHPDDGNINDQTVVSVLLPEPVLPKETITVGIEFEAKLPEIIARTGWKRKANDSLFVLAAQWFPKLGVYEVPGQRFVPVSAPVGAWSTHQFHANSEFYADFGTYEVDISVPNHFKLGATGVKVSERMEGGYRTETYEANDVHDFAWTASNDFHEFEDEWEHVKLRLLIQPEHVDQVERHFDAVKTGLKYFSDWIGPYPYDTLTLVDGIGGSNGMEYPTFITCGTTYKLPQWVRSLELVTIHEFGHQYFYGLLASNEAEEAWLDEGINSYLEMRIMDAEYGEGSVVNWPWIKINGSDVHRFSYVTNDPERGPIFKKSWEYGRRSDYGKASYSKPAVVLATLEHYLGWDIMQNVLKTYYTEWRFKHPNTYNFIDVVEKVAGQDLDWYFDQFIFSTDVVDNSVGDIKVEKVEGQFRSDFSVLRLGSGYMPSTVRAYFSDGTYEDLAWDGEETEKTFSLYKDVPVTEVHIDPDDQNWLDINRLNNRKLVKPEVKFGKQQLMNALVWVQHFFQVTSSIF